MGALSVTLPSCWGLSLEASWPWPSSAPPSFLCTEGLANSVSILLEAVAPVREGEEGLRGW